MIRNIWNVWFKNLFCIKCFIWNYATVTTSVPDSDNELNSTGTLNVQYICVPL